MPSQTTPCFSTTLVSPNSVRYSTAVGRKAKGARQVTEDKPKTSTVTKKMATMKLSTPSISEQLAISWMMKCTESWSSRSCPVSASRPYSTHVILALRWTYHIFTPPKVFSKSQTSSRKLDKAFWALCLRMLVEMLEVCYRLLPASLRRRQPARTPTRKQRKPRHLRQMLSCGPAARTPKLRKSMENRPEQRPFVRVSNESHFTLQSRRNYRWPSYRRYVLGVYHCPEEESPTELRAAAEQHPRRAREQVYTKAAVELQPSVG